MSAGPTAEVVIAGGEWHAIFARVLLIAHVGDVALALVDGNGDGAELELEHWVRSGDEWRCGIGGGLDLSRSTGSWSSGWTDGTGHAVGSA